jgi:hypothetical protein
MGLAGGFSTHLQIEWLMNTPGSESKDFAGSPQITTVSSRFIPPFYGDTGIHI